MENSKIVKRSFDQKPRLNFVILKEYVNKITTVEMRFLGMFKGCSQNTCFAIKIYELSVRCPHCLKKFMGIGIDIWNMFFA